MKITSVYSHKNGLEFVTKNFPKEWEEVRRVIGAVDASKAFSKVSKEKTMNGTILYSPVRLNKIFAEEFHRDGWKTAKLKVQTTVQLEDQTILQYKGFRAMDFVKNDIGVEVQFGKYAFMMYNVSAKMTVFHKQHIIKAGVEIVPMKAMALQMSTGVSFFEQFKTDLEMRGVADIDIPVCIVGVDADKKEKQRKLSFEKA
jgi:hypothetical protein